MLTGSLVTPPTIYIVVSPQIFLPSWKKYLGGVLTLYPIYRKNVWKTLAISSRFPIIQPTTPCFCPKGWCRHQLLPPPSPKNCLFHLRRQGYQRSSRIDGG